jgi:hypothetical protein
VFEQLQQVAEDFDRLGPHEQGARKTLVLALLHVFQATQGVRFQ